MKKIEITNSKDNFELKYVFDKEDWKKIQKKEENNLLKNVKIDGFRPGSQAAKDFARKKIDRKNLLTDAASEAIEFGIRDLIKSEEFINIEDQLANIQPNADVVKISNEELEVVYKFKKMPEVSVGNWREITLKATKVAVEDQDIELEIDKLLKQHSTMQPKAEGVIEKGDTATFDFKGFLNDVPFENGEAKNFELEIGSGQFIPGFEDQMMGMKIEEEKTINVTFPEEYHEKSLAGQPVKFEIKIHDIKTKTNPELDQAFVEKLAIENVKSVDELKSHLKTNLEATNEINFNKEVENEVVQGLIDLTKLSYEDERLYESDKLNLIERNKKQFEQYGIKFEDFLKMTGMTEEKFNEQAASEAKKLYIYKLAMDEIIKQDKVELSDEEFNQEIEKIAKDANKTADEIIELIGKNIDIVKKDLLRLKKIKLIIEELTK